MRVAVLILLVVLLLAGASEAQKSKAPITVTASSKITLEVPSVVGVNTATPIRGRLADSGDVPIGGARVTIRVEGAPVGSVFTSGDGRFATTYTFTVVNQNFTVSAEFAGSSALLGSSQQSRTLTISAALELAESLNATRGQEVTLLGRVLLNGAPAGGSRISIQLDRNVLLPAKTVDSGGRISHRFQVPTNTAPGVHFLNYSAEVTTSNGVFRLGFQQLLHVRVDASLTMPEPVLSSWPLGREESVLLRLRDTAGSPISGIPVEMRVTGPAGDYSRQATGPDGTVRFKFAPAEPGNYTFEAAVTGTSHVAGWSNVTAKARAAAVDVVWKDGGVPEVRKGTSNESTVAILFGGQPTGVWTPSIEGAGRVQKAGDLWRVQMTAAAADEVGTRKLRVTLPAVGFTKDLDWKVTSKPTLEVRRHHISPEGESEIVLAVVDEGGKPVRGVVLGAVLNSSVADWRRAANGTTNENGEWRWAFSAADVPPGPMTLSAEGNGVFLETQASFGVEAVPAPAWPSWIPWALGGVALAAAGGGALLVLRRRQAGTPTPPPPEQAAAALAAHGKAPSLSIELVGAEPGLPPVWGAGEPFALRVRASGRVEEKDQPLAAAKLTLRVEGEREYPHEIVLGADGTGSVEKLTGPEGEFRVRLIFARDDRFDGAELAFTLRLVDYRREIAREFEAVVERGALVHPRLGKQSTPRELQWALEEKLSSEASAPLEAVASVVEHANYSTREVGRADWIRLVRARQTLESMWPAEGHGR